MNVYDVIYNDFIQARKDRDSVKREILSLVYNAFKNKAIELRTETLSDSDCYMIIKKIVKQLDEEIDSNLKVNREEKVNELNFQKNLIEIYLPKQLSECEIRDIINELPDKSMKVVMMYFKTKYNGLVDMSLVNKIAREY